MWLKKLTWQFFLACSIITFTSLLFVVAYSSRTYNHFYVQTIIEDIGVRASLIETIIAPLLNDTNRIGTVDSICKSTGPSIGTRITVVLPSGKVIGDSDEDLDSMDNHANRPEIIQALSGLDEMQHRHSHTLNEDILHVAVPIKRDGSTKAVLRLSVSLIKIREHEKRIYGPIAFASFLILMITAAASFAISRRLNKPIKQMKIGAKRFESGDFSYKLPVKNGEEMSELGHALNSMAEALDDRIKTVTRQRNELDAILGGMVEGVIAVDDKEIVISMNLAASKLLGVTNEFARGKWIHEIIRNSELQKFLAQTLANEGTVVGSFTVNSLEGEKYFQVNGSVLKGVKNSVAGAVIVLNDLTQIRKLENIRKEFVANVSHEIRTPLTSIKGFVETIQNGKYDLSDEVKHFLDIISSKTDRLCSIVNDILSLSSIERDHEQQEVNFTYGSVNQVIGEAVRCFEHKAASKNIQLKVDCGQNLTLKMNTQLVEQAVQNFIDNAIKYSNEGKTVRVSGTCKNNEIVISVEDEGIGIKPEHLDRIFERFYRVDKARSRKLGGTGLGLSIVKNIAVAHGGSVSVDSVPDKGSTFKIHLPLSSEQG